MNSLIQNQSTGGKPIELEPSSSSSTTTRHHPNRPNSHRKDLKGQSGLSSDHHHPAKHVKGSKRIDSDSEDEKDVKEEPDDDPTTTLAKITSAKLASISLEYSDLLSSQLSVQRTFFEAHRAELERKIDGLELDLAVALSEAEREKQQRVVERDEREAAARMNDSSSVELQTIRRDHRSLVDRLEKDLATERAMSRGILDRLRVREKELQALRDQVVEAKKSAEVALAEKEEECRDLRFFLESREKIEAVGSGNINGSNMAAAGASVAVREGIGGDLVVVLAEEKEGNGSKKGSAGGNKKKKTRK